MKRTLILVAFLGVMYVITRIEPPGASLGSVTMLLGFLLLASYLAGQAARALSLPMITGYLVIGVLAGPHILGIIPAGTVSRFRLVNGVALSVIALSAGGELRLEAVRDRLRSIAYITGIQLVAMFGFVAWIVYAARDLIGFLQGQPARAALAVAIIFGLVSVAKSPATTIAVITEEKARGVLTDTVLGITVVKDVVILILIALLIPLATVIADPGASFDVHVAGEVLVEIVLSLGVGIVIGGTIRWYLRRVGTQRILFVLGMAFLCVELGQFLHLEYILIAMAAGFFVQNYSDQGPELIEALESNALPVYALFFAVAGADLNVGVLGDVWVVAGAIIVARMIALYGATYLGARLAGDPFTVRHYAWMGFLAKAGVTLGIANIVRDRFPVWGTEVAAIIIAMIAVNQFIGPPLFRFALVRSEESRRKEERRRPVPDLLPSEAR